ncbi:hypothetical protein V1509DRAFT_621001 [Lipomyces kononenkoae]
MNRTNVVFVAGADVNEPFDGWVPTSKQRRAKSPEEVRQDIADTVTIIVLILEIIYYVYQIYKDQKPVLASKTSGDHGRKFAQRAVIGLGRHLSNYEISPRIATKSELVALIYEQPSPLKDLGGVSESGFAKLGSKYPDAMQIAIDYARDGNNYSSETPNLAAVVSMLDDMFGSSGTCPYIRAMKEGSLESVIHNASDTGPQPSTSRKILGSLKAIDSCPTAISEAADREFFLVIASTVALMLETC